MSGYSDKEWDDRAIRLARKWVKNQEVDFDADDILIVAEALLRRSNVPGEPKK